MPTPARRDGMGGAMPPCNPSSSPLSNPAGSQPAPAPHESPAQDSVFSRFLRFLANEPQAQERRRSPRVAQPSLCAYLGVFGSTQPIPVRDISATGFFLSTDDQWLPGTHMPLRLERTDRPGYALLHCVTVPTRVIRIGHAGVGFSFVFRDMPATTKTPVAESAGGWLGARWADRQAVEDLVAELASASPRPDSA